MPKKIWIATFVLAGGLGACVLLRPGGVAIKGPLLNSLFGRGIDAPSEQVVAQRIAAPQGFQVSLWAEGLPNVRYLRFSPEGALIASQPRLGRLTHVLPDRDGDGFSDGARVLLAELDRPHGIDFHDGRIYIGEGAAITRVPYVADGPDSIRVRALPTRLVEGIPEGGNHWTRTVRVGPDERLYLTVGSSCNVCEEEDPRRAAMLRYELDGSGETLFATGLRNSAGFDWRPATGELFATDNGRDLLGDDFPPCELNRVVQGGFYGWPYANGDRVPDPDFGEGQATRIATSIPPAHGFRAHNAPLGIHFVRGARLPEAFAGAAFVALHGSWNRSELDGYKVVSLHWDAAGQITERDFLTGFQVGDDVIGRPVDVQEGPDGALYVSDDYAGVIYRVAYRGDAAASEPLVRRPASAAGDPRTAAFAALDGLGASRREDLVQTGAALFSVQGCPTCHVAGAATADADRAGAAPIAVKPLQNLAARYTPQTLARYLATPQSPMPPVALPEQQRLALAVFLLDRERVAAVD